MDNMPAASAARRKRVLWLLRTGRCSVPEAARIALVSRQRVLMWCRKAGIDPHVARERWVATEIAKADQAMNRKPTEHWRSHPSIVAPLLPRRAPRARQSKEALRAEGDEALATYAGEIKRLPPGNATGRKRKR